jgi:hypothetical protein
MMSIPEILHQRRLNQFLLSSPAQAPADVVSRLLAVQAQDYLGSLWAIGQRLPASTEQSVEAALANGSVIRTWPMRGTLHLVAAADARWLVGLLAARVIPKTRTVYKKAGLDDSIFKKGMRVVTKALEKNSRLTRDELYGELERARISTDNTRGLHVTGYLALQGLICFGPRQGKQQTFVLMDQWLPSSKTLSHDEALPTLALRYFTGHGPATDMDFAWWSGLTLTEARKAITAAGSALSFQQHNDNRYYQAESLFAQGPGTPSIGKANAPQLLPAYDEFTVAYKDRSIILPRGHQPKGGMEVLSPAIVINGTVVGTWQRNLSKNTVGVQLKPFGTLSAATLSKVRKQAKKYAAFLGLDDGTVEVTN